MPSYSKSFFGIYFSGGYQNWSNAVERVKVSTVLSNPTLLDLISIVKENKTEEILKINQRLFDSELIGEYRLKHNIERIKRLDKVINMQKNKFMPEKTEKVLQLLQTKATFLNDMTLIGGTALSIWLKHRLSEDLDFATSEIRLPHNLKQLIVEIKNEGYEVENITDIAASQDFENGGFDIVDYHQDWLINGVKVTFFTYGENQHKIKTFKESVASGLNGIQVANVDTLAKLKSQVLVKRTKSRDLFDIYSLIKKGYWTIEETLGEMQKSSGSLNYEQCVYRLIDKPIQENDEGLQLVEAEIDIAEIRLFLKNEINLLEDRIAISNNSSPAF